MHQKSNNHNHKVQTTRPQEYKKKPQAHKTTRVQKQKNKLQYERAPLIIPGSPFTN